MFLLPTVLRFVYSYSIMHGSVHLFISEVNPERVFASVQNPYPSHNVRDFCLPCLPAGGAGRLMFVPVPRRIERWTTLRQSLRVLIFVPVPKRIERWTTLRQSLRVLIFVPVPKRTDKYGKNSRAERESEVEKE